MSSKKQPSVLEACQSKVLVFDGGMGSLIQTYPLTEDDFEGKDGCNEILVRSRPDIIEAVHADYFEAGADIVETNSFGSSGIVLAEYDIADQAYELSQLSAKLAKRVAGQFSTAEQPRFVAGSIGPTTKLPTLGHIDFDAMAISFEAQMQGLVDGGADILLIETCQDLLQVKAALTALTAVRKKAGYRVPVMVQVTIETTGTMLVGSDIASVVTTLRPFDIDVLGMNCATGPQEMQAHIRYLSQNSPFLISCLPNAGLPENIGGKAHYHLTPEDLAAQLQDFVTTLGVNMVGGCCGTTPAHIQSVKTAMAGCVPSRRSPDSENALTSLYTSVPMAQDPAPVLVGERTNSNGSKKFRDLLAENDYDSLVDIGRQQIARGAHLLDVCTAYVGRDEVQDMTEVITRFNAQLDVPLMIDSTEPPVLEAALKLLGGKAIVNSINLEDGEERAIEVLSLCKTFGAAIVALTIDEDGMAKTAEKKLAIAKRIYTLAVDQLGLKPQDLVFDTLTFTLGSGDEEFRKAGIETLNAIRLIHQELPDVGFVLGISNISFGLKPAARHVLNSVFLHYAIEAGLTMAIINSAHMLPLHEISETERDLSRQLIFDARVFEEDGITVQADPLMNLLAYYDANAGSRVSRQAQSLPESIEDRLKYRIIHGNKTGLEADLTLALETYPALDIINTLLLDGMKTVGELFGNGEMQLPFVLQSAEVMKASVALLEPHMEKSEASQTKGTMVLATVKGDVHDIGKNLVDIILSNNGYSVINLGIKQPLETMVDAYETHSADAIGMSGLLVKSTAIMKENLINLDARGITVPVVLGGAALTPRFVEEDCQAVYPGRVFYAKDAFSGLYAMEEIMQGTSAPVKPAEQSGKKRPDIQKDIQEETDAPYQQVGEISRSVQVVVKDNTTRCPAVAVLSDIPQPPFWGTRVVTDIDLYTLYPYLNKQALFSGQWQVRRGKRSVKDHASYVDKYMMPILNRLKAQVSENPLLLPKVIYGFFPCQSQNNELIVYDAETWQSQRKKVIFESFQFPRGGVKNLCLADYFSPAESGIVDVIAFQIVTMGQEASQHAKTLFDSDQYSDYLYFHGFGVEMAEALAEFWHKRVREEWGIAGQDASEIKKLLAQGYQGSRYSPGYPACPHLEDQRQFFKILQPERVGISLSEEFMLEPEQSTSALITHHPQARYFDVR
ncbi:MAG: methionine synthase [Cyanobacteria bacterium P01_H01_bin.74]